MLTVAYCRVSAEEQAEEGHSIDAQADGLQSYAELHGLGVVTVIEDLGLQGHGAPRVAASPCHGRGRAVAHVLVWRLDRLSRNLGDLILLADELGRSNVALHSFTEKLDLSTATGRMFYNILGSFAQFYRSTFSENVRMGMHQAVQRASGSIALRPARTLLVALLSRMTMRTGYGRPSGSGLQVRARGN